MNDRLKDLQRVCNFKDLLRNISNMLFLFSFLKIFTSPQKFTLVAKILPSAHQNFTLNTLILRPNIFRWLVKEGIS